MQYLLSINIRASVLTCVVNALLGNAPVSPPLMRLISRGKYRQGTEIGSSKEVNSSFLSPQKTATKSNLLLLLFLFFFQQDFFFFFFAKLQIFRVL